MAGRQTGRGLSPGGVKYILLSTASRLVVVGTQPTIKYVPGTVSPGVKRPGSEADHSIPNNAEVKKTRN
jgi:hypothetical protein